MMNKRKAKNKKKCFVISPIGEKGSETRNRSDKVLEHIIKPIAEECGYESTRADEISEPGIITSQIIQHLIDDDLVIADLTERNANVYYELAIRHVVRKPIVQIVKEGESIPFDVAGTRTIHFDYQDLDSVSDCKNALKKQIISVEKDPGEVDTPISVAIDLKFLRKSKNPLEKSSTEIISMLQDIHSIVTDARLVQRRPAFPSQALPILNDIIGLFDRVSSIMDLPPDKELDRETFDKSQVYISNGSKMLRRLRRQLFLPRSLYREQT
ncbi:MAG: hypothetical protein WBA71_05250 [Candidatus Humimicrobiia bacterium]